MQEDRFLSALSATTHTLRQNVASSGILGKVALVTGGGSGIGRCASLAFAAAGAQIVVANRTGAKAESVAAEIVAAGGEAIGIQVDVSVGKDVQRMVAAAVERFGGVDILFNNAGISPGGTVTEISEEEWDECIAIDLRSVFLGGEIRYSRHAGAWRRCNSEYGGYIGDSSLSQQSSLRCGKGGGDQSDEGDCIRLCAG